MTMEHYSRRWRLWTGLALVVLGILGLIALPAASRMPSLSDGAVFSLLFGLAALMGIGATLAVFNLKP
jgi:Zn-dependent protease